MIFHQPTNSLSNYNYNIAVYESEIWNFHFHKNLELIYVIKGSVGCTVNGVKYKLCSEDFGLCLPYDIHSYHPGKDSKYWVLVFSEDFVRLFSKTITEKTGNGFIFSPNNYVKEYIISQLINNDTPSLFTLKSCLYAICEEYLNSVKLVQKDKRELEIMPMITEYISKNHTSDITLSDIAEKFGYGYNYMSRLFRNIFNMTFSDFLNIYRLETAIKLLDNTDRKIISIAHESGFQSTRNFNYFFKKNMGMSPSRYRKAIKDESR